MATIRKRGDRWQVQVRRQGHGPATRSFLSKADGEAWARQVEARLEQSTLAVDLRSLDRTTFGDLLRRYMTDVTVAKRGSTEETYRLKQMLRHPMALLPLSRLSGATFAAYRDGRLGTVTGETVRRELTILRHVLEVATREWDVPFLINPVSLVKRPPPSRARERRPTQDEIARLLDAAGRSRTQDLRSAIVLAIETGMRRSELLAMDWSNVCLARRVVLIPVTKTGEPRTIPLTPVALGLLESLKARSGPVFTLSAECLKQAWERLCKRLCIVDLHWHDWRHEALSRFFELGLSMPEVALISGHKDPRMLMRYTHVRAEDVAAKLGAMRYDRANL